CYDHLHADVRHWLKEGWIDYVAPQLYQHRQHKTNPYNELVEWWAFNSFGKHVYIGNAPYRVYWDNDPHWQSTTEMPEQVRFARNFHHVKGNIFYSSRALLKNRGGFTDSLRQHFYRLPAFVPQMPWKDSIPPLPPQSPVIDVAPRGVVVSWLSSPPAADGELPVKYLVYRTPATEKPNIHNPQHLYKTLLVDQTDFVDEQATTPYQFNYVITAMDRLNNESLPVEVKRYVPQENEPILIAGYPPDDVQKITQLALQNILAFLHTTFPEED
ncbi:MAG: family 10 glycosylhydrolase, partial [Flammeovirgaceae bacterium]|nr:family 10 glycosylhydrolase [Flammeovirgaceae bacterium]